VSPEAQWTCEGVPGQIPRRKFPQTYCSYEDWPRLGAGGSIGKLYLGKGRVPSLGLFHREPRPLGLQLWGAGPLPNHCRAGGKENGWVLGSYLGYNKRLVAFEGTYPPENISAQRGGCRTGTTPRKKASRGGKNRQIQEKKKKVQETVGKLKYEAMWA